MIKGTSKRVVVVNNPDPKMFEQAIFIVREDVFKRPDRSKSDILREARQVADRYIKSTVLPPRRSLLLRLPGWVYAALGAALSVVVWLSLRLLQII